MLMQRKTRFEFILAVPGSAGKYGLLAEPTAQKAPLGRIPVLEEVRDLTEPVVLAESAAIMSYLAASHGWTDLYPTALSARGQVDSYCHWHHGATRALSSIAIPHIRPDEFPEAFKAGSMERRRERAAEALRLLDEHWIGEGHFIARQAAPTIADFLAYGEVGQMLPEYTGLMDLSSYRNVVGWVARMQSLEGYAAAHASLLELGALKAPQEYDHPQPLLKRLGAATKAGLKAYADAQAGYEQSS